MPRRAAAAQRCVGGDQRTEMSNKGLTFTNDVICYKELIDKEETAKRTWKGK